MFKINPVQVRIQQGMVRITPLPIKLQERGDSEKKEKGRKKGTGESERWGVNMSAIAPSVLKLASFSKFSKICAKMAQILVWVALY